MYEVMMVLGEAAANLWQVLVVTATCVVGVALAAGVVVGMAWVRSCMEASVKEVYDGSVDLGGS